MYLKKSTISNFQSHKKSIFNWHPGVNVIVGLSNSGKSALFRSHNWVIKNRSEDKGFRSHWGGKTDVELIFQDGPEVSRMQDDGNHYFLIDSSQKIDEEYKAFKTDIPEDIVNALNLNSINIQGQFDGPFLLGETPSEVAKVLNQIANLTDIDNAISNVRKKVLANSRDISTTEQQIVELEEQAKSFQYLEQMEKDVKEWESLNQQDVEYWESIQTLSDYINETKKQQKELNEIDLFLKAEKDLEAALSLVEEEKQLTDQINAIESLILKIQEDTKAEKEIENFLKAEEKLNEGLLLIEELEQIEIKPLQELIHIIQVQQGKLRTYDKELDCKEYEFESLMGKQCPLCERKL